MAPERIFALIAERQALLLMRSTGPGMREFLDHLGSHLKEAPRRLQRTIWVNRLNRGDFKTSQRLFLFAGKKSMENCLHPDPLMPRCT